MGAISLDRLIAGHKAWAITGDLTRKFGHSTVPPNETGYECWLRYRPVHDTSLVASYTAVCQRLVAPGRSQGLLSADSYFYRKSGIPDQKGRPVY